MKKFKKCLIFLCFLLINNSAIPNNSIKKLYGPKAIYGGVLFNYYLPGVNSLYIAGDFNEWTPTIKLDKIGDRGRFHTFVPMLLKKKKYRYKLIIDGIWQKDPINIKWEHDKAGNEVSFFNVGKNMIVYGRNPEKIDKNTYKFYYKNDRAKKVYLTGSFNNFNPFEILMTKDENGVWTATAQIFPGKIYYSFIVDGEWILDPTRIPTAFNRFGRKFSVFNAY